MQIRDSSFALLRELVSRRYVILDVLGIVLIALGGLIFYDQKLWDTLCITVGSTLLTLGLSLPIVIYAQSQQNTEHFSILNACDRSGIRAMFASRDKDIRPVIDSINEAARGEQRKISLLGIAFEELFDPKYLMHDAIGEKIYSPTIELRVLLLNPNSHAASRRQLIERGRSSKKDINMAIDIRLPSIVHRRLQAVADRDPKFRDLVSSKTSALEEVHKIIHSANTVVKLYDIDPITHLVCFTECLFSEQYHFGHPAFLPFGECIGGKVPLIQYKKGSDGFVFLEKHFDYLFEHSKDITSEIVDDAVRLFCGTATVEPPSISPLNSQGDR